MVDFPLSKLGLPQPWETHLWQIYGPTASQFQKLCETWLSPEEGDRAQRFRRMEDHDRFVLGRGGLRYLLARYLQCAPRSLNFTYSRYGKPSLVGGSTELYFNVAHSGNWVVLAFSRCQWIGVDVEQIAPRTYFESLIQRCLTTAEQATLPDEPTARLRRFLEYWAIKEAHLKALGLGLSYPMTAVQVSLTPTPFIERPGQPEDAFVPNWWTQVWCPEVGAIAAVCVGQSLQHLIMRSVSEPTGG